jgi:hypothetical protein
LGKANLALLREVAALLRAWGLTSADSPDAAEDVVIHLSMPDASKLIELLATEPRFVAALSLLRAKEEMSSRKEKTVGSRLYKVLTTALCP